jgi:hypothetical protein
VTFRSRRRNIFVALSSGCLLLAFAAGAQQRSSGRRQGVAKVKLDLRVPRERFLLGEDVSVELTLTNTGTAPVAVPKLKSTLNPQPVYRLTGPGLAEGVSLTYRDVKLPAAEREGGPETPETTTLGPGAFLETGFSLNQWQKLDRAGRYTLSARIDWGGWAAASQTVEFVMENAAYQQASLGVDLFSSSTRTLRVVWTSRADGRQVIGESFLYEKRPDLGELHVTGSRIIHEVGPQATEPFCPWTNYDRSDGAGGWHGWREGQRLFAIAMGEEKPQSFDLGSDRAKLVRPALMLRNGEMDVFYLSPDGRELGMVRFHTPGEGAARPPEEAWRVALPEPAVSARAALGRESAGSRRVVALLSQHGTLTAVRLARVQDTRVELGNAVLIKDANALPESEPGAVIAADGTIHVAAVFARDPGRKEAALLEAHFPATTGGEVSVRVRPEGVLESPLASSSVAYPATESSDAVPHVIDRLADGSLRFSQGTASVPAAPAMPLDVLRMSGATYLLLLRPQGGPELFPLR